MTHPAFLAFNTTGMWVGKFETGYDGATSISGAEKNTTEVDKIIVKPNVYSWRNIQVANAFTVSYNYKRELESHMMKNTEWGAVAYLSHSIYGINSKIRANNHSDYKTGYAATTEDGSSSTTDVAMWNTMTGYLASTTGNIMGIYDMSGGAYEYVMGVMKDANGNLMSGYNSTYNSGFNGTLFIGNAITNGINFLDDKYYDIYKFDDENINRARKILGDATGELGSFKNYVSSWYNDTSYFVDTERCWFGRGGISNSSYSAGIFNVSNSGGSAYVSNFFRIALGL